MEDQASAFIGLILRRTGFFNEFQVSQILSADRSDGSSIVDVVVRFGIVREDDFLKKIGEILGFPYVEAGSNRPKDEALTKLPARAVYQYNVLPYTFEKGTLTVVASDPFNIGMTDGLRLAAGCPVRLALCTKEEIDKAVKKYYGVGADAIENMIEDGRYAVDEDLSAISKIDVNEMGAEASIVRFVNQIIAEADRQGATDIHVEPMEDELRIRYRIDGMLHKVDVPPQLNKLKAAIISRIKVMANLDIAEKRLPMDGRIGVRLNNDDIDIRVSTMPTAYGESISLRLLQKAGNFVKLQDLGFNDHDYEQVVKLINRPNGIFLVTGPTGSGKSTSLYAFLHEINKMQVRILTAEDPIEYEMPGINQVLVRQDIGLTFARALRAFLRQDPDIIMVGEIRDGETAEIAINASLTGHMVFSTLHTNDAAGAFARLIDMGAEPFLVASAVAGVMAQRLVRRLCPACKREVPLDMKWYDLDEPPLSQKVWVPTGCESCTNTGYKGRRGLFELLVVTEEIESQIVARKSATEIREVALKQGMKRLREDGWAKVFKGITSVEEVMRVTEENG
ncbi:MAG: Flp pilus assembly complex ATPase component TadA [Kiritimatiellae bacterium]|nr:Flp pilus assembly complex ATPase component TadA [Kiritimatiellia bacterium]